MLLDYINYSAEKVLELILNAVEDLVDFELAVILKLFEDDTLVVQKASGPLADDTVQSFKINLHHRRDIARIMESGRPRLFAEHEAHQDTYEEILSLPAGHSCLASPLCVQGRPIGLMTFDHSACGKFSPGIVKFIATLSRLIALIIDQNDSSIYLDSIRKNLTRERNMLLNPGHHDFRYALGKSPAWQIVLEQIRTVAGSELPVLIQGETGTGKEQTARSIHELSPRKQGPFITLNCSALNASLAESELFGHEKGAFTSALALRRGRFELADGGTLFLDEVADLPLEIQPKLLRTLQEGTFERVGAERTMHCNVRIIAASNKDLRQEVKNKQFREDLFYRLGVFPVFLPPLRERGDDTVLLAEHFLDNLRQKQGYGRIRLHEETVQSLLTYSWPGNVRELQNVIHRGALLSGGGSIEPRHLLLQGKLLTEEPVPVPGPAAVSEDSPFPSLAQAQTRHIKLALKRSNGKIYGSGGAAELLDIKPSTLQSRMKKLGISRT